MKLEDFREQIFFSTVRIEIKSKENGTTSIGTGFLYGAPERDKEVSYLLLISNRHVFGDANRGIILNFHKKKDDLTGPNLGKIYPVGGEKFTNNYYVHSNPEVDLACMNVSFIADPERKIFYKCIFPNMLFDFSENILFPGDVISYIGYPNNQYDKQHNLPLLRKGYIASIPEIDFNYKEEFVIDAQVFPGSSGSPVFTAIGKDYRLLGIVSQTMIRYGKLQTIPIKMPLGVREIIGLGIVIKAPLIKEFVEEVVLKINKKRAEYGII